MQKRVMGTFCSCFDWRYLIMSLIFSPIKLSQLIVYYLFIFAKSAIGCPIKKNSSMKHNQICCIRETARKKKLVPPGILFLLSIADCKNRHFLCSNGHQIYSKMYIICHECRFVFMKNERTCCEHVLHLSTQRIQQLTRLTENTSAANELALPAVTLI